MVSINGLPPGLPRPNKTTKARRRSKAEGDTTTPAHKTPVAEAVAHSVRVAAESDIDASNLHYDLPEGRARAALEQYFNVMNHARREELAQMLGVDIFI